MCLDEMSWIHDKILHFTLHSITFKIEMHYNALPLNITITPFLSFPTVKIRETLACLGYSFYISLVHSTVIEYSHCVMCKSEGYLRNFQGMLIVRGLSCESNNQLNVLYHFRN